MVLEVIYWLLLLTKPEKIERGFATASKMHDYH
jgi:hypothetical protein